MGLFYGRWINWWDGWMINGWMDDKEFMLCYASCCGML